MSAMHTALQSVVKYFNPSKSKGTAYVNDTRLSQIHYKLVSGALVTCAILSGLTSWYSRIECSSSDVTQIDKKYIEEWCYANSTSVVKNKQNEFFVGNQYSTTSEEVLHIDYYQWVTLALLLQAVSFQIPRLIWKCLEGGRAREMVGQLGSLSTETGYARIDKIRKVARFYCERERRASRRNYFYYFAFSQCLYLVNVLAQVCFTQAFLGNEFLGLLPAFIQGSPDWNQVFPKRTKCNFYLHGQGGSPQLVDVSCVLPMNTLYEKLYVLLWALLAVALCAAVAQAFYIFGHLLPGSSDKTHERETRGSSDRLLLKFLEMSLDPVLYNDFVTEMNRMEAPGV